MEADFIKTIEVVTKKGRILGEDTGIYQVFRSIAYARAPVGELRWKRPQPVEPWEGIYDATLFKTRCPQRLPQEYAPPEDLYNKEFYNNYDFIPVRSENSLHLNIWTPDCREKKKYPVAVWIHGGGFGGGFGFEKEFDGAAYCQRDVILVTINYRLGIFGFFVHPWLCEEDEYGTCGNYGIYDQIAALDWVYENIEDFGGDPENITVFGQSAGGASVRTLVSSSLTGNKIKKAIIQSGIFPSGGIDCSKPEDVMRFGIEFAERAGARSLRELRSMPWEKLLDIYWSYCLEKPQERMGWCHPVVDGILLKDTLEELMKHGLVKDIPYIVGSNADDLVEISGSKNGENMFYDGCIRWCEQREKNSNYPAYLYYFTRRLPGSDDGAFHSAELWYTFGTLGRCWRPMEEHDFALSGQMLDYWTNFMKYGNPNGSSDGVWQAYTKERPYIQDFH
ncbi:para-nitrobenzyl esterase [Catenibacillus scindens]|uniref:Carboxylic ester hydrolase n=1 Tax=Catenibacillus scindens TaxID=673271 RepID=A0A7W8M693_9FIRM|nr:carboxylesterase family protein [Catenibacillus scindens]MBB5266078.1 para-nitrobenzyl esterase [Catenibacillus scindens]